jgi:type II secretory pathway pseudopilin PulG
MKKGAMFGLDARIALAIFGALSVISGAALYSAIQESKLTALITELQEVGKAYDAYYLDTGEELAVISDYVYLDIKKLINDTTSGWQGPYVSYDDNSGEAFSLVHTSYEKVRIAEMLNGAWTGNGGSTTWKTTTRCDTGTVGGSCDIWIMFRDIPLDLYNALDEKIDGSVDAQNGNVRYVKWSGIPYVTFLKYRPKQN